jgi:hypothetical protein
MKSGGRSFVRLEVTDPSHFLCPLSLGGKRRKCEEREYEPNQPHGHLVQDG